VIRDDPALRIVSADQWAGAQRRIASRKGVHSGGGNGGRSRGGKGRPGGPKYLLSGLLRCGTCGRHFTIAAKNQYACSSFVGGGKAACSNNYRVNRGKLQEAVLSEMRKRLLAPAVVKQMAKELEQDTSVS
jgi:site-specific DNA recombinase